MECKVKRVGAFLLPNIIGIYPEWNVKSMKCPAS